MLGAAVVRRVLSCRVGGVEVVVDPGGEHERGERRRASVALGDLLTGLHEVTVLGGVVREGGQAPTRAAVVAEDDVQRA